MSSTPVTYSDIVGVLSCVSSIAQSHIMRIIHLIIRLHKALIKSDLLIKLLFKNFSFLSTASIFGRAIFSEDTISEQLYFQS